MVRRNLFFVLLAAVLMYLTVNRILTQQARVLLLCHFFRALRKPLWAFASAQEKRGINPDAPTAPESSAGPRRPPGGSVLGPLALQLARRRPRGPGCATPARAGRGERAPGPRDFWERERGQEKRRGGSGAGAGGRRRSDAPPLLPAPKRRLLLPLPAEREAKRSCPAGCRPREAPPAPDSAPRPGPCAPLGPSRLALPAAAPPAGRGRRALSPSRPLAGRLTGRGLTAAPGQPRFRRRRRGSFAGPRLAAAARGGGRTQPGWRWARSGRAARSGRSPASLGTPTQE